jgi:hypothetical protein
LRIELSPGEGARLIMALAVAGRAVDDLPQDDLQLEILRSRQKLLLEIAKRIFAAQTSEENHGQA